MHGDNTLHTTNEQNLIILIFFSGNIDYVYEGHIALLQPGDKVHYVNITIMDDGILEATEVFIAILRVHSNQVGINLVNNTLPVNIIDNDCK